MLYFLFLALMYFFLWVVYVKGRHYALCLCVFYCFLFHIWYIDH